MGGSRNNSCSSWFIRLLRVLSAICSPPQMIHSTFRSKTPRDFVAGHLVVRQILFDPSVYRSCISWLVSLLAVIDEPRNANSFSTSISLRRSELGLGDTHCLLALLIYFVVDALMIHDESSVVFYPFQAFRTRNFHSRLRFRQLYFLYSLFGKFTVFLPETFEVSYMLSIYWERDSIFWESVKQKSGRQRVMEKAA